MKVRLLRPAYEELNEAANWYLAKSPDLERRFLDEIGKARVRIREHPRAWQTIEPGIRRYRLESFPYGLIYVIASDAILVLAIAHLHREPKSWRDRLSNRE